MLKKTRLGKCAKLIYYLEQVAKHFDILTIVETGTIRKVSRLHQTFDGYSTYHIAQWIQNSKKAHTFYSIDLHTVACHNFLKQQGLLNHVSLIESDSIIALTTIPPPIHFAYLDSANDANHILNEYLVVKDKVCKNGLIFVDDVNLAHKEIFKGDKLVPYLKENDIKFTLLPKNQMVIYG